MNISQHEYEMLLAKTRRHTAAIVEKANRHGVDLEGKLHNQIAQWCDSQWPRWKYRHARMDKRTTEEEGVEDFTIFAPNGRTIHVECKAKGRKLSEEQTIWKHELARLGHEVHVVYSMEEFLNVTKGQQ